MMATPAPCEREHSRNWRDGCRSDGAPRGVEKAELCSACVAGTPWCPKGLPAARLRRGNAGGAKRHHYGRPERERKSCAREEVARRARRNPLPPLTELGRSGRSQANTVTKRKRRGWFLKMPPRKHCV